MTPRSGFGPLLFLSLALAGAVHAQDAAQDTPQQEQGDVVQGLSTGEPVPADEQQPGDTYVRESIQDWDIRCVRAASGEDPCQMYQLLRDRSGTPTSEIVLFRVESADIAAGATIVTPLETLLTRGLTLSISEGLPKRYPFNFCSQLGCVSQIGFSAEEVTAMKRGNAATVTIVPARSQNSQVDLTVSLSGFTAAFDQLPAQSPPG